MGSAKHKGGKYLCTVPGAHDAFGAAMATMCVTALIEVDITKSDISAKESLAKGRNGY